MRLYARLPLVHERLPQTHLPSPFLATSNPLSPSPTQNAKKIATPAPKMRRKYELFSLARQPWLDWNGKGLGGVLVWLGVPRRVRGECINLVHC